VSRKATGKVGLEEIVKYQKTPMRFMNEMASGIITRLLDEYQGSAGEMREWLKVNEKMLDAIDHVKEMKQREKERNDRENAQNYRR